MRTLLLFMLLGVFGQVTADVYQDRLLNQREVTGLASLLKHSVAPGGVRELTVNGSRLWVERRVTPGRTNNRNVLNLIERAHRPGGTRADWEAAMRHEYAALDLLMMKAVAADEITGHADTVLGQERAAIQTELEKPVRYRMGVWDVLSLVPVAAVDPDNPLARMPVTDGFIYLAELDAENSQGFWEIRFGEGFRLSDVTGSHERDAPGFDPPVNRYPGAKRTLTYTESANNWTSSSWSFESRGGVPLHVNHYVGEYVQLGYARKAISIDSGDESLVQLMKGNEQVTLHVVDTGLGQRPIQVTLQHSRYF